MKTRGHKFQLTHLCVAVLGFSLAGCRTTAPLSRPSENKNVEQEIRALYDEEHRFLVQRDFTAQERFFPEDFVVTNPFNQFIGKKQVMERTRADIIKYSRYERQFDAFRIYGDTVIVIGSETVVPTPDAARPDAGKTVHRRFTEIWLRRGGQWQKVVRHASDVSQE